MRPEVTRRDFIRKSTLITAGMTMLPSFAFSSKAKTDTSFWRIAGLLIPVAIEGIKYYFDNYMKDDSNDSLKKVVNNSFQYIVQNNYPVSKSYKTFWDRAKINSKIGTKDLNGVGYFGTDRQIREVMNDNDARAVTPLYSNFKTKSFEQNIWNGFCDLSDKTADESNRVWVTARDNRKSKWKETFWIDAERSYIVTNPKYYCYGLPIENPVINHVRRDITEIKAKTGKSPAVDRYYTQRFCFQGTSVCSEPQEDITTVYWGHDNVIREWKNLKPLDGCGDTPCKGEGTSSPKLNNR